MKWVRAKDGALFGVCKGIAKTLGIPTGVFRLMWIFSVLFFGAGIALYLMLAISLPREDKVLQSLEPWILGVCSKISLRTNLDVGIVRFLAISLSLLSFGSTIVGYVVLYFVMDDARPEQLSNHNSESKPNTPPAIV